MHLFTITSHHCHSASPNLSVLISFFLAPATNSIADKHKHKKRGKTKKDKDKDKDKESKDSNKDRGKDFLRILVCCSLPYSFNLSQTKSGDSCVGGGEKGSAQDSVTSLTRIDKPEKPDKLVGITTSVDRTLEKSHGFVTPEEERKRKSERRKHKSKYVQPDYSLFFLLFPNSWPEQRRRPAIKTKISHLKCCAYGERINA